MPRMGSPVYFNWFQLFKNNPFQHFDVNLAVCCYWFLNWEAWWYDWVHHWMTSLTCAFPPVFQIKLAPDLSVGCCNLLQPPKIPSDYYFIVVNWNFVHCKIGEVCLHGALSLQKDHPKYCKDPKVEADDPVLGLFFDRK